ncbi:amino acid adenylation domain-containing protein [Nocardia sp. NPDC058114]|uniref:amino acid adenylation domain-containing protein n=1 Tax=Nocardia sp. NPDC058114 TaxID=3346346 RepID=UPI0036DDF2E2
MTLPGHTLALPDRPLVHLEFERHAAAAADRVAVTCGPVVRSYGELNARANQLAHHLRSKSVGPGSLVGLCLDRTPCLIEAILGVLKAGAAYVPLDTSYPPDRLRLMLAQLPDMAMVIGSAETEAMLGPSRPETILLSDEGRDQAIRDAPVSNPQSAVTPADLCYVVFTSGSTGTPKATAVRHSGWYNLLNWLVLEYGLDQLSSSLVVSSFGFDITQRSIMTPLFSGAAVHLLGSRSFDLSLAYRLLGERDVRTLHCAPSTLYLLVDREMKRGGTALTQVGYVFIGGEALSSTRVSTWATRPGNTCVLLHQYGVAECTDVATSHPMTDYPGYAAAGVTPAGKPVYNTTIHLLGEHLDEVGPGEVGEICISGASVGAGYINPSEEGSARFTKIERNGLLIPVYRTGDRGYVTPGGELVLVGRMDSQVKIRGHRIDLGEVDQAVRRNGAVNDAAVVAVADDADDLQLIAFVIPTADALDKPRLRKELLAVLPHAMVPAEFVEVTAFPLNPNGKVDRKALAAHGVSRSSSSPA